MPRKMFARAVVLMLLIQGCTDVTPPTQGADDSARPPGSDSVAGQVSSEVDLGDLGGGSSLATDINNSNVVVGWSFLADGTQRAFRWTQATGMTDLGVLPGHNYSRAIAVKDDGRIIGISGLGGTSDQAAVQWDASGAISRLDIPLLPGTSSGEPSDFNQAGTTVGWDFGDMQRAWAWSGGSGKADISSEAGEGGEPGYANAVNTGGTVTGTTTLMCGEDLRCWRPFVWRGPNTYSELALPSGAFGVGFGLNNSDVVVGWAQGADNVKRPYRWRGAFEWLPATTGAAFAVNALNVAVGSGWDDADQVPEAVAWTASGGLIELSPSTHTAHSALAVNDKSLAVGYVSTASGTATRAMLWPVSNGKPRAAGRQSIAQGLLQTLRPVLGAAGTAAGCVTDGDALVSRNALFTCLAKATSRE